MNLSTRHENAGVARREPRVPANADGNRRAIYDEQINRPVSTCRLGRFIFSYRRAQRALREKKIEARNGAFYAVRKRRFSNGVSVRARARSPPPLIYS